MFWYGAYVSADQVRSNIEDGILKTIETFTQSNVRFLDHNQFQGLFEYAALEWNLLVLSPLISGWVGVWGGTPRFHQNVFQENSFSGITLEVEDDKDHKFWSYKVWEAGKIIDWYISNPTEYFAPWKNDSIKTILLPYLIDQTQQKDVQIDDLETLRHDLFFGRLDVLERKKLIREGLFSNNIITSFSRRRPAIAFKSFLANLKVPFNNIKFDPFNFGVYLDVKYRKIDLNKRKELVTGYKSINSIKDLDSFSFLIFDLKESEYPTLLVY